MTRLAWLLLLPTSAFGATWNIPADGALGTVVLFLSDGDVLELDPGCCGGGYFPIPQINARVTVRSSDPVVRAAAPAMQINATPGGGMGVVMERLTFAANANSCTGNTYCTLEVSPGVRLELRDVGVTTGSGEGLWVRGSPANPVTLIVDGFDASGSRPVVTGSQAVVELRNGTITGIAAAELAGGSFLGESLTHTGGAAGAGAGLVDATDLDEARLVGLVSDGAATTAGGGLIRAVRSDVWLEDAEIGTCAAAGGALLDLQGAGNLATLVRVTARDCASSGAAALIQGTGYDVSADRVDVAGATGAGAAALIDLTDGALTWLRGDVCGVSGAGTAGVRVAAGSMAIENVTLRALSGVDTLFAQEAPTADGLLAQLTVDAEGAGLGTLVSGGAVELFNDQLWLDGAAPGSATWVGRSGHNHAIGGFPAGWTSGEGDLDDSDPGWDAAYLAARGDCSAPGIPRLDAAHPAWDGGYTTVDWHDPDCTPSDLGVFGGPDVDLERATWFGGVPCSDEDLQGLGGGGDLRFAGGLASCACGGGAPPSGWWLLLPWLWRRRR